MNQLATIQPHPAWALLARPGVPALLEMLTYRRPAKSETEREFLARYIDVIPDCHKDDFGNRWIQVGDTPRIMWSVHTDTVHHAAGRQKVLIDSDGMAVLARKQKPKTNCLGADDTAGVWLALEMIAAGVEGVYVFHREEECGGNGSAWIAKHMAHQLEGLSYCIALDRKGYGDVITHQFAGRCCSEAFAQSLAKALGGSYAPDDTGSFTDSANYTDLIGECTNLSIGYFAQHGPTESLDVGFLCELRDTLCSVSFADLICERQPGDIDPDDWRGRWGGSYSRKSYTSWPSNGGTSGNAYGSDTYQLDYGVRSVDDFVRSYPMTVAYFLEDEGITLEDLRDYMDGRTRKFDLGR